MTDAQFAKPAKPPEVKPEVANMIQDAILWDIILSNPMNPPLITVQPLVEHHTVK